jgi:fucose permease
MDMTQTFHRDRFTWLAYLLFAFFAYFLNIFGPITPFLKDELSLSYTVSSLHFTAYAVGILLTGLSSHMLIERLGRRGTLWLGAFGTSVSTLILIAGQSSGVTIGASFCMGVLGSLILVIIPSALSDQHGELRAVALSESNVIASLVSAAAPLMIGWVAYLPGGWRLALAIPAFAPFLFLLLFGRTVPPQLTSQHEDPASVRKPLPLLFWVYWVALVLAVSVEFCMIFWSADYLENSVGLTKVDAARSVSLFLAAFIIGRLAGSRLVQWFSTRNVIIVSVLVAAGGFLLFWMTGTVVLSLAGLFLTGLGVAGLYPLLLSLAMGVAHNNTVLAGARATLASGTAILALPLVLGRLADMFGIQLAYGVVGILLIGILLIVLLTGKKVSGSQPAS